MDLTCFSTAPKGSDIVWAFERLIILELFVQNYARIVHDRNGDFVFRCFGRNTDKNQPEPNRRYKVSILLIFEILIFTCVRNFRKIRGFLLVRRFGETAVSVVHYAK